MKIDLVMWAKNGGSILGYVLKHINKVVPSEFINNRFVVNDHSVDSTPWQIQQAGWTQIINEGHGISSAANTALKQVETEVFCSFEQDIILANDWFKRVKTLISKPYTAAVSGVRFLPKSNFCYGLEPYHLVRKQDVLGYGKTLDNTMWKTDVLREFGGFPVLTNAGLDTYLANLFEVNGYKWLVDLDCKSVHYHNGFLGEMNRYYFYGLSLPELQRKMLFNCVGNPDTALFYLQKLVKSPVAGLRVAGAMKDGRLCFAYPFSRLMWLLGYIRGRSFTGALDY